MKLKLYGKNLEEKYSIKALLYLKVFRGESRYHVTTKKTEIENQTTFLKYII